AQAKENCFRVLTQSAHLLERRVERRKQRKPKRHARPPIAELQFVNAGGEDGNGEVNLQEAQGHVGGEAGPQRRLRMVRPAQEPCLRSSKNASTKTLAFPGLAKQHVADHQVESENRKQPIAFVFQRRVSSE